MADKSRQRKLSRLNLAALLLTFILPFAVVVCQLIGEINQRIEFTQYEIYGNTYLRPLEQLLADVPISQLLTDRYFRQTVAADQLKQQQKKIAQDIEALAVVDQELGVRLGATAQFQELQATGSRLQQELSQALNQPNSRVADVRKTAIQQLHVRMIAEIRSLISQVGDRSNLILDPDLDSYYLMDSVLLKLPEGQDLLAQLRLMGEKTIDRGEVSPEELSPEEKGRLIALVGLVEANNTATQKSILTAFRHNPAQTLQPVLESPAQASIQATTLLLSAIERSIIKSETLQLSLKDYDRLSTTALSASSHLWQQTVDQLDELLHNRIQKFLRKTYFVEAFALLVLAVVLYIFIAFGRNLAVQKRTERRVNLQHSINRILSESITLQQAAPQILQSICHSWNWDVGEIWQVDEAARVLRLVETWCNPALEPRQREVPQHTLTSGTGTAGIVWQQGSPVWIEDLQKDRNLMQRVFAENNIRGICGLPIASGDRVVGVVMFLSQSKRESDSEWLRTMGSIAYQMGQFIERQRTEAALRHSEELQRMALNAAQMGAWDGYLA